jgi:hypothetical protein
MSRNLAIIVVIAGRMYSIFISIVDFNPSILYNKEKIVSGDVNNERENFSQRSKSTSIRAR